MMENITSKPLDRLTKLLAIDIDGCGQDWELVCADPNRIAEFCDIYERESLNAVEKSELMRLIVASYDQALESGSQSESMWQRIIRLLEIDFTLRKEIVEYWSLLEEADAENVFPVTPLMREVWHRHNSSEI
jgi:hypothetical protein